MTPESTKKELILPYLLQEMPEEEREDFERVFFESDEFAAEVLAAEERLLSEYDAGKMETSRRMRFEQVYGSSPALRQELSLHRMLVQAAGNASDTRLPQKRWRTAAVAAVAACVALLALGLILLMDQNRKLRTEAEAVRIENENLKQQQQSISTDRAENQTTPGISQQSIRGAVPAITLIPGIRDTSARIPELIVPQSAAAYVLQADVRANATYRARIETVDGSILYEAQPLTATELDGKTRVQVFVPASQLKDGDYILSLRSVKPDAKAGEYYFRLIRK